MLEQLIRKGDRNAVVAHLEEHPEIRPEVGLLAAAEYGSVEVVALFLERGANPDETLPPALCVGIESGEVDGVRLLVEAGADLGSGPYWEDGDHPLTSAAYSVKPEIFRLLVDKGCIALSQPEWIAAAVSRLCSSRKRAAGECLFLLAGPVVDRLKARTLRLEPSLAMKMVRKLEKLGKKKQYPEAAGLAVRLKEGLDQEKAEEGQIIDWLDEFHFDDLLAFIREVEGTAQAHRAGLALLWSFRCVIWSKPVGDYDLVDNPDAEPFMKELLKLGPDVHLSTEFDKTALMYAAHEGRLWLVEELLVLGADPTRVESNEGKSVWVWAERSGNPEVIARIEQAIEEWQSKTAGD